MGRGRRGEGGREPPAARSADRRGHLLEVPLVPWEWMRFETELAAYSVVQARSLALRGFVWSLQSFNEVAHLMARGLR